MSVRYVWEKWNVATDQSTSSDTSNSFSVSTPLIQTDKPPVISGSKFVPASGASSNTLTIDTSSMSYVSSDGGMGTTNRYYGCPAHYTNPYYLITNNGKYYFSPAGSSSQSNWTRWIWSLNHSDGLLCVHWNECTWRSYTRYQISSYKIKGSTSYGNVSSASSSTYPSNSYSGSYWYVSKGNDTIDPASVTYPASPNGGELIDITIAPSTGIKFGGTIKNKVEYQLDGGSWQTAVESTTSTTVSVLIPKGTQTFAARATASDDTGFTSTTAVTGETVNVVNNAAPVISCETSSLGEIAEPFSVTYSVSDEDGDTMTITEKIDGITIRSYSASSGSSGEQTFSPDAMQWLTTLNGSHTATITADDGKGGVTTHSISFTRAVHTMTVTLEEPMETDAAITKCVVNIARNLPADAEWSLLVTNNAFDPEPVWEDITQYVKNGWNWVFENQTVTSGRYGFNFKLTCTRGVSGQGGSVDTISGGFE